MNIEGTLQEITRFNKIVVEVEKEVYDSITTKCKLKINDCDEKDFKIPVNTRMFYDDDGEEQTRYFVIVTPPAITVRSEYAVQSNYSRFYHKKCMFAISVERYSFVKNSETVNGVVLKLKKVKL